MLYNHSSARILLSLVLISPLLRFAFASQEVLVVNETIKVPVSLGVTSRDDDALYVQIVFDNVLKQVSDKVNMTFGYVKECVLRCMRCSSQILLELASGLMMSGTGCDVLQIGLTVRGMCNSYVCANTLHSRSGGILSCVKIKRERRKLYI